MQENVRLSPTGSEGILRRPDGAKGLILFAHGSGSGRLSPRNNQVAAALGEAGFATLLFDLLTEDEALHRRNVFDIGLLASRMVRATEWVQSRGDTAALPVGYFGASTGAAAALVAAAAPESTVRVVVSRGGRPDLAGEALGMVRAATLLIVGSLDGAVLDLNRQALAQLRGEKELEIVQGAGHLFEEPGTMDEVIRAAIRWFDMWLPNRPTERAGIGEPRAPG